MSSFSVHCSPTLSEALRNMDNILFLMGMQSTGSQDPWQKSCGAVSIHLSVAGLEMIMVNVHWSKRFRDLSPQPEWTICISFPLSLSLSHIVVLVGVLLVSLHIVPVNKRLYPLLQVSRLKEERRDDVKVNTRGTCQHFWLFLYFEVNTVKSWFMQAFCFRFYFHRPVINQL